MPRPTTVTLPYIQGLLEPIKRILEQLRVAIRFRPDNTLRKLLVRLKDPVPPISASYTGSPARTANMPMYGHLLSCRVKDHQRAVWNGDTNASALAEHAWKEKHNVQNAEMLEANQQYWKRCLLESWHITKNWNLWTENVALYPRSTTPYSWTKLDLLCMHVQSVLAPPSFVQYLTPVFCHSIPWWWH